MSSSERELFCFCIPYFLAPNLLPEEGNGLPLLPPFFVFLEISDCLGRAMSSKPLPFYIVADLMEPCEGFFSFSKRFFFNPFPEVKHYKGVVCESKHLLMSFPSPLFSPCPDSSAIPPFSFSLPFWSFSFFTRVSPVQPLS